MKETNQITIYETEDGKARIEVRFENENVWLTQKQIAELFDCSADNVSLHLKNIYAEKELESKATTEEFSVVQKEGQREVKRNVTFYSLEAIIAVGYRVNTQRGTQFRQWATDKLKNYILKGFALDSERFKRGSRFDRRYFEELLEEIREIPPALRSRFGEEGCKSASQKTRPSVYYISIYACTYILSCHLRNLRNQRLK